MDECIDSEVVLHHVIPAKAGISLIQLDSRFHGNDISKDKVIFFLIVWFFFTHRLEFSPCHQL